MSAVLGTGVVRHPKRMSTAHIIRPDGSKLIRIDQLPWTPWAMPGTHFKLLRIDDDNATIVLLLKVAPHTPAPEHHHLGSAETIILEGCFSYDYGTIRTGDYVFEPGGCTHDPTTHEEGAVMFAIIKGGLQGVNERGEPHGPVLDANWHYDTACANGAADHISRPALRRAGAGAEGTR